MSSPSTAKIIEWHNDRGFGFLADGKRRTFLHIRDFAEMNEVYNEYFGEAKPARTTVQATLPGKGIKVEIDCVAYKP